MLILRQSLEDGAKGGSANPFEDRVLALEDVVVGGLPGVDIETAAVELVEVPLRLADAGSRQAVEPTTPPGCE